MKIFFSVLLITLLLPAFAQKSTGPILDRVISIHARQEKLDIVLARISREASFSFSYNSAIVSESQTISIDAEKKTVREILNEIFKGSMEYKEKSSHLILTKVIVKPSPNPSVIISGYVEDVVTREKIRDASVYDKKSMTSAITDEGGFFRMKFEKWDPTTTLSVSKHNYRDTLIAISAPGSQYMTISISPMVLDTLKGKEVMAEEDTVQQDELPMPYTHEPNIMNISDTIYRDIQLSVLPFFGTNGRLSGNVVNNYSINVFGGYSRGTREIELGVFVNIDRDNASWLQIAGIGNLVGRNVYGVQASGFFNVNGGETKAVQLTGFGNINFEDFKGVQVAGLGNINLQGADGALVAGLVNFASASSRGVQIAGLGNLHMDHYYGSQIAGGTNFSRGHISGSQISALFNYGGVVHGTQIGLINYADSLGGVPIGLISFVRSGYHKIELSADEVFYTNLAFRTGVRQFYNIIMAGIKPEESINTKPVWTFGYGIGTAPRLTRWLDLNLDLTAQHVNNGEFTSELSLLNKIHLGLDFRLAKKLSLYGGVTLNGYLTNPNYADYPQLFTNHTPSIIYENTFSNNTNLKMWWGAQLGLRIL